MFTKLLAVGAVAATNALFILDVAAQEQGQPGNPNQFSAQCGFSTTGTFGKKFLDSLQNFIGSPVFYLIMFVLALGGLYSAIVKQDSAGWWAVGFAAIGAATPSLFKNIVGFVCGVMSPALGG